MEKLNEDRFKGKIKQKNLAEGNPTLTQAKHSPAVFCIAVGMSSSRPGLTFEQCPRVRGHLENLSYLAELHSFIDMGND